jgi:hypothetical protein
MRSRKIEKEVYHDGGVKDDDEIKTTTSATTIAASKPTAMLNRVEFKQQCADIFRFRE